MAKSSEKTQLHTQVLIIGGGATGTAIARDLALRGVPCVLVEKGDLNAARRMYRVALALDPSYEPARINLDRVSQWQYVLQGIDLGMPVSEEQAARK